MSMTREEWTKMTQNALVVLRREISLGQTKEALDTLRAFDEHLRNPPACKAEVMWVMNKWLANASKNTRRAPQFSFSAHSRDQPNVLKFTDEQRDNLLMFMNMIFDGVVTVNTKTGVVFPVNGNPQHRDTARVLATESFAIKPKEEA